MLQELEEVYNRVAADKESLDEAFGAGQGKHAGKKRRRHSNKYASDSTASSLDPWEEQLRRAEGSLDEVEALERAEMQAIQERRRQRRAERGEPVYPDEEEIDPYDPSTFGFIEVSMPSPVRTGPAAGLQTGVQIYGNTNMW